MAHAIFSIPELVLCIMASPLTFEERATLKRVSRAWHQLYWVLYADRRRFYGTLVPKTLTFRFLQPGAQPRVRLAVGIPIGPVALYAWDGLQARNPAVNWQDRKGRLRLPWFVETFSEQEPILVDGHCVRPSWTIRVSDAETAGTPVRVEAHTRLKSHAPLVHELTIEIEYDGREYVIVSSGRGDLHPDEAMKQILAAVVDVVEDVFFTENFVYTNDMARWKKWKRRYDPVLVRSLVDTDVRRYLRIGLPL